MTVDAMDLTAFIAEHAPPGWRRTAVADDVLVLEWAMRGYLVVSVRINAHLGTAQVSWPFSRKGRPQHAVRAALLMVAAAEFAAAIEGWMAAVGADFGAVLEGLLPCD
jgi:hypothetical protein